ncbi:MAG TPA: hypothetical protein VFB63_19620 [Bryobacteraceae bacterium]|nr:hypothetical protein [Bryobacteraceae bacterium]
MAKAVFKRGQLLCAIVGHSGLLVEVLRVGKKSITVQGAGIIYENSFDSLFQAPRDVLPDRERGAIRGIGGRNEKRNQLRVIKPSKP